MVGQVQDELVHVGSLVRVDDGEVVESWRIVEAGAADALTHHISEDCPLAGALLGCRVGERVRVRVPCGMVAVTVLEISH
jgi:transcription elongation GreA/GreB family factor